MPSDTTYFIQAVQGGPIKIGYTSQIVHSRLASLMTGSPVPLRVIGTVDGNQEQKLHELFKDARLHGEWFEPTKALIQYISANARDAGPSAAELKLVGRRAVAILATPRPRIRRSYFDRILENDDKLIDQLELIDWGDGGELVDEDDPDFVPDYEPESPTTLMWDVVDLIDGEPFIEAIGINEETGHVGFLCGPCNSRRRFGLLEKLGDIAFKIDALTAKWWFFALLLDAGRQTGVDLLMLTYREGREAFHLFDPLKHPALSSVEAGEEPMPN